MLLFNGIVTCFVKYIFAEISAIPEHQSANVKHEVAPYEQRHMRPLRIKVEQSPSKENSDNMNASKTSKQRRQSNAELVVSQRRDKRRNMPGDGDFVCVFCRAGFKTLSSRWSHYRSQHPVCVQRCASIGML